jgi:NAD(P)-dependent dehydrogenase (short-subunit alcohol dehydrogenase family)
VQQAITTIGSEAGRIDALVPAAAMAVFNWIDTMTYAQWQHTLRGELDIVFLCTHAAWPWLKASGRAAIVNFASANAHAALNGSPALAHCAGKGGVMAMTRQLAMEGAPWHPRQHDLARPDPDPANRAAHGVRSRVRSVCAGKMMIKRIGQPEDIAWTATFLCSDEAGYITGADFRVDAGSTAW